MKQQEVPEMLQRHLDLLVHACACKRGKEDCAENCVKMREMLTHVMCCPTREEGGCQKCRRVWLLMLYHAKQCRVQIGCPVPKCPEIKDALTVAALQPSLS